MSRHRLPMFIWLWLLWIALWGSLSAVVLVGGLLVAAGVLLAFRMPPLGLRVVVHPWRLLVLFGHLLTDLVGSATAVAWAALRYGRRVPAAVVEVRLAGDSDLLIAATTFRTSLGPGSLVLEIDREQRLLYVHVLPVDGPEDVERSRRAVLRAERAVTAALDVHPS